MTFSTKLAFALTAIPAVFAATYNVQVGPNGKLVYDPEYVVAAPGDVVNFTFNPKNHTVTQSAFNTPCVPLPGGISSGFNPVTPGMNPLPTFQVHVTDNNPIWIHCEQVNHCPSGMVFAINPPTTGNTLDAFKQLALASNTSGSSIVAATYSPPPPPQWAVATATVTYANSVYTTTYTSYDGTPPPTPAAAPIDHKILVGNNGSLSYDPPSVQAAIGDTVTFEFRAKNHTVTQSTFNNPCVKFTDGQGNPGFSSGFQPVAAGATTFPTFQIKINDTAPIWGYCSQTGHCGAGMVFAINSVERGLNNFAAFQQLAKAINGTSPTAPPSSSSGSNGSGSSGNSDKNSATGGHASKAAMGFMVVIALAFGML
ncbi:hypothetical protein BDN72DRAFT_847335 [Pluteus cervinus]|uniref:Uncharacterized protein n=1 Tax=Pluteus cervinus TaxID=181527 RepID=A0ACD3ADN6_9AGAR|nr:hypothetical protein BDN72DRAFT_847335 [Pluteus cervinus]